MSILPAHPRTQKMMAMFHIELSNNIVILPPLSFKESLFLWKDAALVMTDSGGLIEETTALGIPCVTLRENTEKPITIELGTNIVAGTKMASILEAYKAGLEKRGKEFCVPPRWDGMASRRICEILVSPGADVSFVF